jgi:hypothetical protein
MSRRSTKLLKAALAAVHYSGAENILAPFTKGAGVIFMLHQCALIRRRISRRAASCA